MNAKDTEIAKASSEERKRNRKSKRTAKTLAIPEEQLNDEEKEDIVDSSSEETSRKTDKTKNKKSAAKRKRSSKHAKPDELYSSDEDKPKAKRPKRKSSRKKGKKGKKQEKHGNECEYSENNIADETEMGADILKLLLHPCTLPFEVQNKLLFYLDNDEINILAKDRFKSKEGYEAGPTFNFHDHAYEPKKNLLRVKPGQNTQSNINKIYDEAGKAYLVEIGKAGDSTDSNTYIKDDRLVWDMQWLWKIKKMKR